MDDDVDHRADADSVKAVLAAMDDAGIRPDEDVLLVGHSQGGMVASVVAGATVGRYSVRHVVTAGSPVAGYELPKGVKGTHLETQGEGVSDLDAAENRATPERVTVTGEFRTAAGEPIGDVPHGVGFHQRVLAEATDVGDRGLEENLADVEEILAGDRDDPQLYEARLVEPPERCVAPLALPAPFGPPSFPPPGLVLPPRGA
nr:hypothetical protein [Cellulosimicrobium arenosum]